MGSVESSAKMRAAARTLPDPRTLDLTDRGAANSPDAEVPLEPGSVFAGKYVVEREIGRGGLGVIVRAEHAHLGQSVAIKYLQKRVLGNHAVVARFAREASLAAQIKSDHVVRVHDVAMHPDIGPYMVMEYLEGTDLARLTERGPLPIAEAVDYVLQTCDALAEAHALGIVHRDIKPENLFLARRSAGRSILKILDFGISKGVPAHRVSGGWSHVTAASETFGTPAYMSPEQLRSTATVDRRTDIWALGVALFEMLTTEMPFNAENLADLCACIAHDRPRSLRSIRPEVPFELERVVMRCLEKDPERRFYNVAELAQELSSFGVGASGDRASHIARLVRDSGVDIRPPARRAMTLEAQTLVKLRPLLAAKVHVSSRELPTLDSVPAAPEESPRSRRGVIVAVCAGLTIVGALAWGVASARDNPRAAAPAAGRPSAPISAATSATAAPPTPAPLAQPAPHASDVTTTAETTLAGVSSAAKAPAAAASPSPAPGARKLPVATPDRASHEDDYSKFGSRQ